MELQVLVEKNKAGSIQVYCCWINWSSYLSHAPLESISLS